MRTLKNFVKSLVVASVLAGCGGSGGGSSLVDDVDPSVGEVDDNTVAEQPSSDVQPDPPVQGSDEQSPYDVNTTVAEVDGDTVAEQPSIDVEPDPPVDEQSTDDQDLNIPDQNIPDQNIQDEVDQSGDTTTDSGADKNDTPEDASDNAVSQNSPDDSIVEIDEPDPVVLIPIGQVDATGAPVLVPLPVPETVAITAGCFDMGSPLDEPLRSTTEGPRFNVCVNEFRMGEYEVTFVQYDAFALATGRATPDSGETGRGDRPVINVSWNDAMDYVLWLSEQTGRNFRLPTEAEWEYAARAGTQTPFNTGPTITSVEANFNDVVSYNGSVTNGSMQQTLPVGSFNPNGFELHDMHGNVQEWTCSAFVGDYRSPETPQVCDSSSDGLRTLRGGGWRSIARNVRSAQRNPLATNFFSSTIGFRVLEQ